MLRSAEISRTDRVAICLPNGPELAVVLLGVTSVSISVPLNPDYRESEYERYLSELGIKLLIVEASQKTAARAAALKLGIPVMELPISAHPGEGRIDKHRSRLFSSAPVPVHSYKPPEAAPFDEDRFKQLMISMPETDDIAVILHTAGTTSRSKIVPLTHGNILAATYKICDSLELEPIDRCLGMLPQFHIGGLVDMLLAPLASGGSTICTAGFDATRFFAYIREYQPTWYQAVPTTLFELLNHARENGYVEINPPLRFIRSVSSPLPPSLMNELESGLGVPVIEIYGMTEAAPLITSNPLPPNIRKPGSVGVPFGPEVKILDEDNGGFTGINQIGEVVLRGPNLFAGYEGDEGANAEAFYDGWFRTGDLGYLDDDGYLFLKGRVKEMINRGGEKISPHEIDSILLEHPAVAQAVTFPIPHRTLGEAIAALVVLNLGEEVSAQSLTAYLRERVAEFKVPQHILIADEMPKGATGKVRRLTLADELKLDFSAEYIAPRNEAERLLVEIWADVLNLPEVGIRDNFFDLGGFSLLGLELYDRVEKLMDHPLPEDALMQISTVESMAAILNEDFTNRSSDHAVTTRNTLPDYAVRAIKTATGSSRIPASTSGSVFLELNSSGNKVPLLWCFNRPDREMKSFARELGPDQPVIGFYSGAALFEDNRELVSATANFYCDRILEMDVEDPIILGGHCRGAAVVLEAALKLSERGRPNIGLLLMEYFDPMCFEYPGEFTLLYGRQSIVQGFKRFNYGGIGWRERFAVTPEVELINGYHGSFWAKPFVEDFAKAVTRFISRTTSPLVFNESR
ncbi:MAG: hypothetical protein DHS20C01_12370 [marine bacterium B5-7]|nr:MAG: hypothetical protein DHS20C01_12370 [marine bacterium B5-7]